MEHSRNPQVYRVWTWAYFS